MDIGRGKNPMSEPGFKPAYLALQVDRILTKSMKHKFKSRISLQFLFFNNNNHKFKN
jgi:hypothetical protein